MSQPKQPYTYSLSKPLFKQTADNRRNALNPGDEAKGFSNVKNHYAQTLLVEQLSHIMRGLSARYNVRVSLQSFLDKYKDTDREAESRAAVREWRTQNNL